MNYLHAIKLLLNELEKDKLLKHIETGYSFYDEPRLYRYQSELHYSQTYSDGVKPFNKITGSGISFTSKTNALLKCVVEGIERLSSFCFKESSITYASYHQIKKHALNPTMYINDPSIQTKKFGWVSGYDLTTKKNCLIPAQLIYLNYLINHKEPYLSPVISTGTAAGFDIESTLLAGLYEAVERDAFMTTYLNTISVPRVNLDHIKDKTLNKMLGTLHRYNLQPFVFNITTDILIPSFMCVLIDKTNLGPMVVVGAKTNLNGQTALIGAVEEACMIRPWLRKKWIDMKFHIPKIHPNRMKNLYDRAFFWSSPIMVKKLDYLLRQPPKKIRLADSNQNPKNSLTKAIRTIQSKGYKIFYVNMTVGVSKKMGLCVFKVIIPGLQPLYLTEDRKQVVSERLKRVSDYFGQKRYHITTIPHPFL